MRRLVAAAAIAALTVPAAACGPKAPDYSSVWTTSSATATTTTTTDKPVPLSLYLDSIGVTGQQVAPSSLTDLKVSIPTPSGWAPFTNPHIAPQTLILAKGGKYPTARLVVFKLIGDFDPAQVIKHGNDDAQLFQNFKQLDSSMTPFNGFPSSMIQGSYNSDDGTRLHSWNRIVLPTGSPPAKQRYFVQLTITGLADQAAAQSTDIDAIIHGFVVAAK
ncbi:LpqN/LpqT family lipoprotein [Mycobacterium montefiorense]|uniref:LpqN/LpqT family lipoprotein n=1 Tax=Mycobacterium montefiorense TaxID=154654 RepID=UPI0021DBCBB8|nr:LpqN/LpqT family lipoprotein [Mycobacterium montefiorense]MCV7428565.1 LpqN/LpqT family lipoprotein [Mycobacterium montefiorense]GLE54461.1 putative lipoprotein LpqT [Mycobacterium montefiorense]